MQYTDLEQAMLDGKLGTGAQWAIAYQSRVGAYFEAETFATVRLAHMISDAETLGPSGIAFLEELASRPVDDRRLRTLAVVDSRGFDERAFARLLPGRPFAAETQRAVDALARLGAVTGHGYFNNHSIPVPAFGESCSFSGTPSVIYVNSVVGARSNFEAGPSAVAAMLTGRVARYGFHMDKNRRGTDYFVLDFEPRTPTEWGAVGAVIGEAVNSYWRVPVIDGVGNRPDVLSLNHLGLCLASFGSLAMFHMIGVTPEAPDVTAAFDGAAAAPRPVSREDVDALYARWSGAGETLDVVALGAPQLTLTEVYDVADALGDRRVHPDTTLLVYTPLEIKQACERVGVAQRIEAAGGLLVHGPDFFVSFAKEVREANRWQSLMTQSVKMANITEGYGYRPLPAPIDHCIESAVAGRILPWR